jgi:hypothetical protein
MWVVPAGGEHDMATNCVSGCIDSSGRTSRTFIRMDLYVAQVMSQAGTHSAPDRLIERRTRRADDLMNHGRRTGLASSGA